MKKFGIVIICTLISLYFALTVTWDYTGVLEGFEFYKKFFIVFGITEIISLIVWNKFSLVAFQKKTKEIDWKEFIVYFLIITIPIICMVFSYYPAIGHSDTIELWNNIRDYGITSNWHPVVYQFIFIYLPLQLWNNIYSTMIAQVLFIMIVILYMCAFFRKNFFSFKQMIILLFIIVLNPIFLKYSVYVVKDIPFACFVLLLTLHLINIVKSEGKWLDRNVNKLFFIISSIGVLTIRHNGLIPFVGCFILLFILFSKIRKFVFISFSAIMISFLILTGPIYRSLNIGESGGRIEMVGVVLNNLSFYYNNDVMREEEKNVIFELHRDNIWSENYRRNPRDFNLIKNYELGIIECEKYPKYCNFEEELGFGDRLNDNFDDILRIWFEISKKNPDLFIKSWLNVTSPIWEITKKISGFDYYLPYEEEIAGQSLKLHDEFHKYYKFIYSTPFRIIGIGFGEGLFIIILSILIIIAKLKFNLKKLMPFVPTMLNTASIMLLITGEEYRFVYAQVMCAIPLLIYALYLNPKFETKN